MKRVMLQREMSIAEGNQRLLIKIDQPQLVQADEYSCDYRIELGGQVSASETVSGGDEIQAVMLAFDAIREKLKDQFPDATLLGLPVELAFPRSIPYVAGLDTYRDIETLVEKHLKDKYG